MSCNNIILNCINCIYTNQWWNREIKSVNSCRKKKESYPLHMCLDFLRHSGNLTKNPSETTTTAQDNQNMHDKSSTAVFSGKFHHRWTLTPATSSSNYDLTFEYISFCSTSERATSPFRWRGQVWKQWLHWMEKIPLTPSKTRCCI